MSFFIPDVWQMTRKNVYLLCPRCDTEYPISELSRGELRRLIDVTRFIKLRLEFELLSTSEDDTHANRQARMAFLKSYLANHAGDLEKSKFACERCERCQLILPDNHYFQTLVDEPWFTRTRK